MSKKKGTILWQPVSPDMDLPEGRVLITNNISATYNDGKMSHVWIGTLEKISSREMYKLDDGDSDDSAEFEDQVHIIGDSGGPGIIRNVEYWAKIPDRLPMAQPSLFGGLQMSEIFKFCGQKGTQYYSTYTY